jgi:hypothetical protein
MGEPAEISLHKKMMISFCIRQRINKTAVVFHSSFLQGTKTNSFCAFVYGAAAQQD